jgi:hypothetical protein
MLRFPYSLLIFLLSLSSVAQTVLNGNSVPPQKTAEQRRAELRQALTTLRTMQTPGQDQQLRSISPNRFLSPQERSDLRQQLSQQRRDAKPEIP